MKAESVMEMVAASGPLDKNDAEAIIAEMLMIRVVSPDDVEFPTIDAFVQLNAVQDESIVEEGYESVNVTPTNVQASPFTLATLIIMTTKRAADEMTKCSAGNAAITDSHCYYFLYYLHAAKEMHLLQQGKE